MNTILHCLQKSFRNKGTRENFWQSFTCHLYSRRIWGKSYIVVTSTSFQSYFTSAGDLSRKQLSDQISPQSVPIHASPFYTFSTSGIISNYEVFRLTEKNYSIWLPVIQKGTIRWILIKHSTLRNCSEWVAHAFSMHKPHTMCPKLELGYSTFIFLPFSGHAVFY